MAVHDVHDDSDACGVGGVDEFLQLLGGTETRAGSEETADVVSEAAVVGVLLDGHDLDAVVAILDDSRQHLFTELGISSYAFFVLRHTNMALVNKERRRVRFELCGLPLIGLLRSPCLRSEEFRLIILHDARSPCGDAFALTAFPMNGELEELAVLNGLGG